MSDVVKPQEVPSYTRMSGEVYDLVYLNKDYASEAEEIANLIKQRSKSGGNTILEAACGTGSYLQYFRTDFTVEGFDLSKEQVVEAKKKLPRIKIAQANMLDFDMGKKYDAVLCLFSSIGYLLTKKNLDRAIANFAKHTKPGGIIIIEPWIMAENFVEGKLSFEQSNSNDNLSVARMGLTEREGNITKLYLHHMVGTSKKIEHFVEEHQLAMYTDVELRDAFAKAALSLDMIINNDTGRRLYIGVKPLS